MLPNEKIVHDAIRSAAELGDFAPSKVDLGILIGVDGEGGTISEMVWRIEQMGCFEVKRGQRGWQFFFADGKATARPLGKFDPHHTRRPRDVPTPSLSVVRARRPDAVAQILVWASGRNIPIVDALADLVWLGWQVEQERG